MDPETARLAAHHIAQAFEEALQHHLLQASDPSYVRFSCPTLGVDVIVLNPVIAEVAVSAIKAVTGYAPRPVPLTYTHPPSDSSEPCQN